MRFCSTHILVFLISQLMFPLVSLSTFAQPVSKGLFDSDEPLTISLKGKVRELLKDRDAISHLHPLQLVYKDEVGVEVSISVNVNTRGYFRKLKANCSYPPLMIQFAKDAGQISSIFRDQLKLKLVMPCAADEYIIREWLVYKIYNLVTPKSFKARLVKVQLEDERSSKPAGSFYGILLEEEKQMARRNKMIPVTKKLSPQQVNAEAFHTMAVFEYLIGNTDWSTQFLQNVKLIARDSTATPIPVPYDFDHAGIVRAPYAHPAEELQLHSTRQRRYRGYCITNLKTFEPVIADFNRIKDDVYKIYATCPIIDTRYKRYVTQYLDEFYDTINDPMVWKKDFSYPCDKSGTGNVIIKGLREN